MYVYAFMHVVAFAFVVLSAALSAFEIINFIAFGCMQREIFHFSRFPFMLCQFAFFPTALIASAFKWIALRMQFNFSKRGFVLLWHKRHGKNANGMTFTFGRNKITVVNAIWLESILFILVIFG